MLYPTCILFMLLACPILPATVCVKKILSARLPFTAPPSSLKRYSKYSKARLARLAVTTLRPMMTWSAWSDQLPSETTPAFSGLGAGLLAPRGCATAAGLRGRAVEKAVGSVKCNSMHFLPSIEQVLSFWSGHTRSGNCARKKLRSATTEWRRDPPVLGMSCTFEKSRHFS